MPLAKLQWSHLAQSLAELACDLLGPAAVLAKGGPGAVEGGGWSRLYVFQRYTSIGAGTTEVQKNIIADKAIKLPGPSSPNPTVLAAVVAGTREEAPPVRTQGRRSMTVALAMPPPSHMVWKP